GPRALHSFPTRRSSDLPQFPIGILDAAFVLLELGVRARLARRLREEQRTAKALAAVAVGVRELIGGVHAQPFGTDGDPIGVALRSEEHTSELQSRENLV